MEKPDLNSNDHARTRRQLAQLEALLEHRTESDRQTVLSAADWMLELHWDQAPRPDGTPYVQHPLEVCLNVHEHFGFDDVDILVAALLHDAVEDQAEKMAAVIGENAPVQRAAVQAIEARFGARAAALVEILTNPDWRHVSDKAEKNAKYREHFREIPQRDPVAFAIKLADFSTNALRLDRVEDENKLKNLASKYCPVMADAVDYLAGIPTTGHELSLARAHMLPRLEEAIGRYCRVSP